MLCVACNREANYKLEFKKEFKYSCNRCLVKVKSSFIKWLLINRIAKIEDIVLAGWFVFKMYDTYGYPIDLTKKVAAEYGIGVDGCGFNKEMEKQRKKA